ncbi:MAG: purine-nucleoside phosphorylase [Clostridia bacterium]|nr:purine-nucleoside phosphorylase [Clostridia bacterium]
MAGISAPTLHIKAERDQVAKTVLMPGDPLRSKFIAENFLENAQLFNNVRGVQGYTGTWKGARVSVMASGMGMPSIGIYSYELYNGFDVENIIRIGSAGALREDVALRDIVFGMGTCTNSNYGAQFHMAGTVAPIADFGLLRLAVENAERIGASIHVGNLLSADTFYDDLPEDATRWNRLGVLAVEMEAAALYMNAARAGKKALAMCTISDHLLRHEGLTAEERETSFTQMMEIALDTAKQLD